MFMEYSEILARGSFKLGVGFATEKLLYLCSQGYLRVLLNQSILCFIYSEHYSVQV